MSILRWKSITSCLPPECVCDPRHRCFVVFEVPVTTSTCLSDFYIVARAAGVFHCIDAHWVSIDAIIYYLRQTGLTIGSKSMTSCLLPECAWGPRYRCFVVFEVPVVENGGWIRCLNTSWLSIDVIIYLTIWLYLAASPIYNLSSKSHRLFYCKGGSSLQCVPLVFLIDCSNAFLFKQKILFEIVIVTSAKESKLIFTLYVLSKLLFDHFCLLKILIIYYFI